MPVGDAEAAKRLAEWLLGGKVSSATYTIEDGMLHLTVIPLVYPKHITLDFRFSNPVVS